MIRAQCKKWPCRLCHGDIEERIRANKMITNYTSPTRSSAIRTICSIQSPSHGNRSALARTANHKTEVITIKKDQAKRPGLFTLPVEIRNKIYCLCIKALPGYMREATICGHIEGGSIHHPDYSHYARDLTIYANAKVPVNLLLVNKQIRQEAEPEAYRMIKFHLQVARPTQLENLQYWLGKHSLRYTKRLEIPFMIYMRSTRSTRKKNNLKLSKAQVNTLGKMLTRMPYLTHLDILLLFGVKAGPNLWSVKRTEQRFRQLLEFKAMLPSKIKVRFDVDIRNHDLFFDPEATAMVLSYMEAEGLDLMEKKSDMNHTMYVWGI